MLRYAAEAITTATLRHITLNNITLRHLRHTLPLSDKIRGVMLVVTPGCHATANGHTRRYTIRYHAVAASAAAYSAPRQYTCLPFTAHIAIRHIDCCRHYDTQHYHTRPHADTPLAAYEAYAIDTIRRYIRHYRIQPPLLH